MADLLSVSGVSLSDLVPSPRGWLGDAVRGVQAKSNSALCVDPLRLSGAFKNPVQGKPQVSPVTVRLTTPGRALQAPFDHLRLPLRFGEIENMSSPKVGLCHVCRVGVLSGECMRYWVLKQILISDKATRYTTLGTKT